MVASELCPTHRILTEETVLLLLAAAVVVGGGNLIIEQCYKWKCIAMTGETADTSWVEKLW